ncbi:hypothetical protein GDO78_015924 [Eleutherodactylus coqui]|uniref:C2H2-type domain-containing protein n=2 Tax=Eleutherodactylus coqui TaxID=57060 RepID=A0A8J6JJ92_ELECQ|nr:hypothetical protein GDO78_015924 [Eleutherodactylus coqui]
MHITFDILYLLTGEDYIVLKMSGGRVTHSSSPVLSGGFCRNQSSNKELQTDSVIEGRKNDEKILELANKITQLLTGEVPLRCQDVTVYFSVEEECDVLERASTPTNNAMSENQEHITSPDKYESRNKELYIKSPLLQKNLEEGSRPPCVLLSEIPTSTSGTQTLVVKEETYETVEQEVNEEAIPEHASDSTGTSSNKSMPEKFDHPASPDDSSEDKILQDDQCDDFDDLTIEIKSLEDGEQMRKWNDEQREEENFTKNRKPDLPRRTKRLLKPVIEADEEAVGRLQRTAEWEIHEDGSTHLMMSGGPPNSKRKSILMSRPTPDCKTAHPDVNAYPCSECDKCFSEGLHLESHRKVHSIPALFACTECGKSFTSSSELSTHIKVHTEEKLFACSECGKCFTVKSNLLAHKAIHMGDKPFACAECDRRFALKSSLDTHMSIHALEKPYVCSVCGKCFTSSARLAFHQTTHVGEKTYECEECGKVFTASGSLNRHKRTHTGEKPYACRICGKCFNRETNLYRHQMIHTR